MFDLRYHVASLAAVFAALAVGIVIGVAIASGGTVEDTTQRIREDELAALRDQVEVQGERADVAERERDAAEELVRGVYPALVSGRLAGRAIAVLFLGPLDGGVRAAVERTLTDAGAGSPVRTTVLELPPDLAAVDERLAADPALAALAGEGARSALGAALGRELALGGEAPLWELLEATLVQERTGAFEDAVDAAVVVRSWTPGETDDVGEAARLAQAEELAAGVVRGLDEVRIPVVGVETSSAEPSTVDFFRELGVSIIDHVNTLAGRLSLAVVLAGGAAGHYGTKDGAEGVAPAVEPVTVTVATSGE
ncbi:MAG: copper transporter [Thermoleophilia bacterium]|nr:copper transporter [Thermoleophilia bacterium]